MKKLTTVFLAMLTMAISVQAQAGFKDLKNLASPAAAQSSAVSEEAIVQNFSGALATVLRGQDELRKAFGLKIDAAKIEATVEVLSGGATVTQADLKKALAISAETIANCEAKLEAGEELSEEGRAHYVNGLVLSAQGVVQSKALAKDASDFSMSAKDQIKSASMMQKAKVTKKLAAGMFVAKELPSFTSNLIKNVGLLISFAKSAGIDIPEEATAVLPDF